MRFELPELRRCCCCLPLRRGLILWVYVKLIFDLLLLAYSFALIVYYAERKTHFSFSQVAVSIQIIAFLTDVAFCIVFLVSAHRKRHEHMRLFYRYATIMLIIGVIAVLGVIGFEIYIAYTSMPYTIFFWHYMVSFTSLLFIQLVLHAYLIILVRSEVLKLERSANFEFTNHTSEPECKAQIIM